MKNFILTMLLSIVSIFVAFGATPEIPNFSKIVVETPCRIIYGVGDTTFVSITNKSNSMYNVYYEIKNDIIYIKSKETYNLGELIYYRMEDDEMPIVRIMTKDTMPSIYAKRSSFQITERQITERVRKNKSTFRNETTNSNIQ